MGCTETVVGKCMHGEGRRCDCGCRVGVCEGCGGCGCAGALLDTCMSVRMSRCGM